MHLNFCPGLSALWDLLSEHLDAIWSSIQSKGQHDTGDKIKLLLDLLTIGVQLQDKFRDRCLKAGH